MLTGINGLKIIGITGNLASGKSCILDCIKFLGSHTISCDQIIHHLLIHDTSIIQKIAIFFPEVVTSGSISRKILAQNVFSDLKKLKLLEQILHPKLHAIILKRCLSLRHSGAQTVFIEVPLLFEKGNARFYDNIIMVYCPKYKRVSRYIHRYDSTHNIQYRNKCLRNTINILKQLSPIKHVYHYGKTDQQRNGNSNIISSKRDLLTLFKQIESMQINEHKKTLLSNSIIYNG